MLEFFTFFFYFITSLVSGGVLTMHSSRVRLRNVEYSILPVMSELSTVLCDRALGLWMAGTRASSVDGELPWRSKGRAVAVASTPVSRAQAETEGGFLGLRHKTKEADGGCQIGRASCRERVYARV